MQMFLRMEDSWQRSAEVFGKPPEFIKSLQDLLSLVEFHHTVNRAELVHEQLFIMIAQGAGKSLLVRRLECKFLCILLHK